MDGKWSHLWLAISKYSKRSSEVQTWALEHLGTIKIYINQFQTFAAKCSLALVSRFLSGAEQPPCWQDCFFFETIRIPFNPRPLSGVSKSRCPQGGGIPCWLFCQAAAVACGHLRSTSATADGVWRWVGWKALYVGHCAVGSCQQQWWEMPISLIFNCLFMLCLAKLTCCGVIAGLRPIQTPLGQ